MTLKKKILSIVLVCLLVIVGGGGVYAYGIFHSVMAGDLNTDNLSLNTSLDATGIVNIALFGIDGRDVEGVEGDRTDTIMIASVNFDTGEVKVISLMRDLLVQLSATEKSDSYLEKINAAYAFGGVEAEIRTLNENFDLNIRDYAVVNFDCMVDTVDALGGVDVDIKNEEVLHWTNLYAGDVSDIVGKNWNWIDDIGVQHLDGVQALGYCRNRYSDDDYGRTARQREVVTQIAEKLMHADLLTTLNVLRSAYPYVTTSFSIGEITSYAQAFLSLENKTISTCRLPFDGLNTTGMVNEISYVIPTTLADNVKVLHYYLFGDENYVPSPTVSSISSKIIGMSGYGSSVDWSVMTPQNILDNMAVSAANDTGTAQETVTDDTADY